MDWLTDYKIPVGKIAGSGFDWLEEKGAFFFDASGTVPSGTELTDVYDSLNPDDIENWPSEAFVSDTS